MTLAEFARTKGLDLTRFAYLLCSDRGLAEDLVQDCYLSLYRRFGDSLPVDIPLMYARRVIVNGYLSSKRRKALTLIGLDDAPDVGFEDQPGPTGDPVWSALQRLPQRQRAVLVMRFYLDLADSEIAEALGCRPGSVRSLAARAYAELRTDRSLRLDGEL